MSEQMRPGTRCQTLTLVRAVKGDLPCGSQGVIIREMENFGRHLIFVHWDVGISVKDNRSVNSVARRAQCRLVSPSGSPRGSLPRWG
jgi:hypothetical protein